MDLNLKLKKEWEDFLNGSVDISNYDERQKKSRDIQLKGYETMMNKTIESFDLDKSYYDKFREEFENGGNLLEFVGDSFIAGVEKMSLELGYRVTSDIFGIQVWGPKHEDEVLLNEHIKKHLDNINYWGPMDFLNATILRRKEWNNGDYISYSEYLILDYKDRE